MSQSIFANRGAKVLDCATLKDFNRGANRGRMRTRAQVRCNRGDWVRVRASILAQAQVRTTGRARVWVRVGACG